MLEKLDLLPPDPILGLSAEFKEDARPFKVNLGVGVYKNDAGVTPIFDAVKQAEKALLEKQTTKAYIGQAGDPQFLEGITELLLGEELKESLAGRVSAAMTPGGSGALRMLAGMIVKTGANPTVWVSDPTWGNHFPLLESAGLQLKKYPYYSFETGVVDFEAMLAALQQVAAGDIVLLHGCCHNPTGADLSVEQWNQIIALAKEKRFVPFIDTAYQGFSESLDADAYGLRVAAAELPEVLVASSCSKNFGVYRERAGMVLVIGADEAKSKAALSHILVTARRTYSMSSYHGPAIVGEVLNTPALKTLWEQELAEARTRINGLRTDLAAKLNKGQSKKDFSFIDGNSGMFSFLGLSADQAQTLRREHAVYILNSSRINIAGLSSENLDQVVEAISKVINKV